MPAATALVASLRGAWSTTNRAPPDATEAIRRVARRYGLGLVDADELARGWYPPAPDWRRFSDACHPTPGVMLRVAREVERVVAPDREAPPLETLNGPPLELQATLDGMLRLDPNQKEFAPWMRSVAVAVPQWLAEPGGEALLEQWLSSLGSRAMAPAQRAFVLAGLAEGFRRAGRPTRASALYAQSPPPESPWVAAEWALWLLHEGRLAEARSLLARFAADDPTSWVADELAHGAAPPR